MIDEFVCRGAEVVVFGDESGSEWNGYFSRHNVKYRSYQVSRNGMNPAADIATLKALKRLLDEEKPDKVWTYQAKPNIYGSIAAHQSGIPEIYVMMGGLGSVFRAGDLKSRVVRAIVAAEYRYAMRFAKTVFFQNHDDVGVFESLRILSRGKAVLTHGSGVNISHFSFCQLPDSMRFLFVGRLVRGKGIMDYLYAARIVKKVHPEVAFDVVGPFDTNPTGIKSEELQPYVDDGIVTFHGEQRDVLPFLINSSVFVLPSYYGEGTPKSALEAMAVGRPLIVADAVGCREVVDEGYNGFLVPPKNPGALSRAMINLIENDELRKKMGAASRKMAEMTFDVVKVNEVICHAMGIKDEDE